MYFIKDKVYMIYGWPVINILFKKDHDLWVNSIFSSETGSITSWRR